VGKFFNFLLRLALKRDEEWDCASKSGGFVSIFPTGDMTPDFLHSLGQKWTFMAAVKFVLERLQCAVQLDRFVLPSSLTSY